MHLGSYHRGEVIDIYAVVETFPSVTMKAGRQLLKSNLFGAQRARFAKAGGLMCQRYGWGVEISGLGALLGEGGFAAPGPCSFTGSHNGTTKPTPSLPPHHHRLCPHIYARQNGADANLKWRIICSCAYTIRQYLERAEPS